MSKGRMRLDDVDDELDAELDDGRTGPCQIVADLLAGANGPVEWMMYQAVPTPMPVPLALWAVAANLKIRGEPFAVRVIVEPGLFSRDVAERRAGEIAVDVATDQKRRLKQETMTCSLSGGGLGSKSKSARPSSRSSKSVAAR